MKLYIAGSSKDLDRCERAIAAVRALGHEVTFDWCAHVRSSPSGANVGSDAVLAEAARLCLAGVMRAHLLWLLVPAVDKPSAGAWWEVGAADMAGVRIIASDPDGPKQACVFLHLPSVRRYDSDAEALETMAMLARPA